MMKKRGLQYCLLIFMIWSFGACNDNYCTEITDTFGKAILESSDGTPLYVDSLSITALSNPPVTIVNAASDKTINFIFSMNEDSTRYIVYADIPDTVVFHHNMTMEFVSSTCGFSAHFKINKIDHTKHRIDSIAIENNQVTPDDIENFKIYLRSHLDDNVTTK